MANISLESMAHSGKLVGTLLRHPYNAAVYWSPDYWHSPSDGFALQPGKWRFVCSDGWYANEADKRTNSTIRQLAGDMWPQMPGEYATFPREE